MDYLTLSIARDDDGTAELLGRVQGEGGAGSGSAWFNIEKLEAFCAELAAYPIDSASPPCIAGGYWDDRGDKLMQTHLSIRLTPFNSLGALQVSVQFAQSAKMNEDPSRARGVSTWFVVGYNDVQRFRTAFSQVLSGAAKEAVLASTLS